MNRARFSYLKDQPLVNLSALFIGCGYEERSIYAAQTTASAAEAIIGYSYGSKDLFAQRRNAEFLRHCGVLREAATVDAFERMFTEDLHRVLRSSVEPVIGLDISSLDRARIGAAVRVIDAAASINRFEVRFLYSEATFDSLGGADETVLVNGPVPGYEGWTTDPSAPVACIVGLGFENILALAALETLEPSRTVAFAATGSDRRFEERVSEDNAALMSNEGVSRVAYGVQDPFRSLHQLEGVVHALVRDYRVALIPLGPKIFALLATLIAHDYENRVALWRVSAGEGRTPKDRKATGRLMSLAVSVTAR